MFRSSTQFDKSLEKATSQLLLETDWDSILQICDCIRQGDVQPKYALTFIRKKISNDNPHVSMYALQVLESVVKNCGQPIHQELATKECMEFMKDLVKVRPDPVKAKILELIQVWSHAFRNVPSYRVIKDTFNLMKMEGYTFPTLRESDAMFAAERAPEWRDGEVCHRCRVGFGTLTRKHHCRNCGEIFCGKCSAKNSIIPRFGIEKEVRVCDACYEKLNKPTTISGAPGTPPTKPKSSLNDLPDEYVNSSLSQQPQVSKPQDPPGKSDRELQEEEELMLAMALSQSEEEAKQKERTRIRANYGIPSSNNKKESTTTSQPTRAPEFDTSDMDPELARYLNRNYWENKAKVESSSAVSTTPSAPSAAPTSEGINTTSQMPMQVQTYQNGEIGDADREQFLNALRGSIEIFVNRMKSNSMRGRSIANDSAVQTLFMTISAMQPQLMKHLGDQEEARAYYETLQDKLTQLKDAREALDSLREDYREKKRLEEEEKERQRQIQLAQKLEIMRQKKHEYLEYQRQLAIQRMQEQEREMQMRLEQQKHLTQMRQMQQYQYPGLPQAGYGQPQPGFSPSGSLESSPSHHYQQQQQGVYTQPQMGGPPSGGPPSSQPVYNQQGGFAPPSNYQQPPGGFQPPVTAQVPPVAGQVPYSQGGGQQPVQGAPQQSMGGAGAPQQSMSGAGAPQQSMGGAPQQMPQGVQQQMYTSGGQPGSVDYQNFNMQGMASALPQQQQMTSQPGQYNGQQGQYVQQPQGQYVQGQPQGQHPEAQLISFD